ncbi:hypothetical protein F543_9220 [Bibersteinia trehalosi USDA-ARS-USMARC-189]|uniref:Uncharacterized protein n=1 Tax=Bibersteinia trehalosi USDA-ARS-USMARC-189 TaxID=1263831 RepID=A0ABN4BYJ7_BIBTR|nr:hypothetical protein WQG_14070 [Bibersteinia trehalosi USDA-ARS-USMARC-192]AHG83786.1 hypothetical protein F543_9220 [Bibersteinia trehalosi USDA-ARS-USMARC-189]
MAYYSAGFNSQLRVRSWHGKVEFMQGHISFNSQLRVRSWLTSIQQR